VVFPEAEKKYFLTARAADRASRRAKEQGGSVQEIQRQQVQRDAQDTTRKAAPMQVPEAAMVVDTTELNLEQVIAKVLSDIREQ